MTYTYFDSKVQYDLIRILTAEYLLQISKLLHSLF